MKTYRVTGEVECHVACPHCEGHTHTTPIDTLIEADNEREARALVGVADCMSMDADAKWSLVAQPATLSDLERKALADWNASRPTSQPLALAQARGGL